MQYIFVYSYQPDRGDKTREFGRHVREMEPGLSILEMIYKVEGHLRNKLNWWCDPIVVNAIPNITPVQMTEVFYEKAMQALAENPIPKDLLTKGWE